MVGVPARLPGDSATVFDGEPPIFLANGEPVHIDVFHVVDTGSQSGASNDLNPNGKGQAISGLVDDGAGLTIAFEDVEFGIGDNDFNDTVIDVLPIPSTVSSLPFVNVDIAIDTTIEDADDLNLVRAVVEVSDAAVSGDVLTLTSSLDGTGITVVEDGSGGRARRFSMLISVPRTMTPSSAMMASTTRSPGVGAMMTCLAVIAMM